MGRWGGTRATWGGMGAMWGGTGATWGGGEVWEPRGEGESCCNFKGEVFSWTTTAGWLAV